MPEPKGVETDQELVKRGIEAQHTWVHAEDRVVADDGAQPPPPAPRAETPVAGEPVAPPAPVTEPLAAPAAGATAAEVIEFIDALIGDGDTAPVHRIPTNARIPLEVDGKIVYKPIAELREGGMRLEDYSGKTREVADARRELEEHAARLITDGARLKAREEWVAEEAAKLREAQKSPEAWEKYLAHLARLDEDPEYKRTFDDALEGRERRAEDVANQAARRQGAIAEGVATVSDWILEIGNEPEYLHVDLDRVRELYATTLQEGGARKLDPDAIRAIFASEAQLAARPDPSQATRITALQAQVDALTAAAASAAAHNAATSHAVQRDRAVPVATGAPAAPTPADKKVAPFTPRQLPDVNRDWAARRD